MAGASLIAEKPSLVGKDEYGLGKRISEILIDELFKMGADFISCEVLKDYEESFYESLGFEYLSNTLVYHIDKRPYLGDERYITKRRYINRLEK